MVDTFVIHDVEEKDMEGEVEDWVPDLVKRAPVASSGMLWHRYHDPANKEIWFSCVTQPDLWCYENEVANSSSKDGTSWFRFQGVWQEVVDPPPPEPTAATSTAAIQPNPTEGNGTPVCTRGGTLINECAEYGHLHPCPLSDR